MVRWSRSTARRSRCRPHRRLRSSSCGSCSRRGSGVRPRYRWFEQSRRGRSGPRRRRGRALDRRCRAPADAGASAAATRPRRGLEGVDRATLRLRGLAGLGRAREGPELVSCTRCSPSRQRTSRRNVERLAGGSPRRYGHERRIDWPATGARSSTFWTSGSSRACCTTTLAAELGEAPGSTSFVGSRL